MSVRTSSIRTRVLPDSECVVGSSSCCRLPDSVPSIDVRPACDRSACPRAHRPPRIAGSRRPPIDRPDPVGVSATDPFTLACRQASASSGTAASSVTSICPAAVVPIATGPRTPDASNRRSTSRFSIRPTRRLSRAAPAAVTASVPFTSIAPASDVTERESTSIRPAAYVASAAMLIDGAVPRRTIGPSNLMFTVGSAISPRTCTSAVADPVSEISRCSTRRLARARSVSSLARASTRMVSARTSIQPSRARRASGTSTRSS